MLLPMPVEMLNNPKCYKIVDSVGCVPTEEATEHETKVVKEFNLLFSKMHKEYFTVRKENSGL